MERYLFLIATIFFASFAFAQSFPSDQLVVFPAKQEVVVAPGESKMVTFQVVNNLAETVRLRVLVEDLEFGETQPLFALRPYVELAERELTLAVGQTAVVSATITLPSNLSPGSRHAAIIFEQVASGSGQASVTNRLGALLFVRVAGESSSVGQVTNFFYSRAGGNFIISFANKGNTYLNPYGFIKIKPLIGQSYRLAVDPWYVLPGTERSREIAWTQGGLGVYRATLQLNRGYDDVVDQETVWVWRLPVYLWFGVLLLLVGLIIAVVKWRRR